MSVFRTAKYNALSGFHRHVDGIGPLLEYYTGSSGNHLATFRDNIYPIFKGHEVHEEEKMKKSETSVKVYHSTLRNIQEEGRYQ
jgi:hypothetical protein